MHQDVINVTKRGGRKHRETIVFFSMVGLLGGLNFIPIEDLEDREPLIIIFFVTNQIGILAPGSTTTIVFTSYFLSSHVYLSYST